MEVDSLPKLSFASANEDIGHPRIVHNRAPTPQDLLELSSRIYKSTRKLYNEADSQGMRVYHDERIAGDVRLVMIVPSWFPKAHVAFDWERLHGNTVSVAFVIRGTMQDLIGNTRANLQLLFNKLIDDQHLPDVAADATKVIQTWLQVLLLRQPVLDPSNATTTSTNTAFNPKALHLDVHVTGHSLGGLLAEVATVESLGFAAEHGASWKCTSFESPGVPDIYHRAALRVAPVEYWQEAVTGYLAAPNPINMLYEHLGRVVHVVVPWEQSWSHVAKCVGTDVARVTAWALMAGVVLAFMKHVPALRQLPGLRQQQQDEDPAAAAVAAAANAGLFGGSGILGAQQCSAIQTLLSSGMAPAAAAAAGNLVAAPAAAVAGPPVPGQLIFTVVENGPAPAMLDRVLLPAAAAAAHPASNPTAPPSLTAAAVAAAAAAGEAAASIGGTRILNHIARRTGLGVVATVLQGWVFGRGGIWGVLECLAGVLGVEVEELIAQHSLCPMRQCFDPHTGQLKERYRRDMMSWPHLGHRRQVLLTAAQQAARWTLPSFICRDNVGVANLMSRTAMVEARCSRLAGYVMIPDPDLELTHQERSAQEERLADRRFDVFLDPAAAAGGGGDGDGGQLLQQMRDASEEPLLLELQQQQLRAGVQAEVPAGLGVGLPGLPVPRREHQQQQRLPRKLLLGPGSQQQQQQQDDLVMTDAADALDAAECGAANPTAAAGSSAAAAIAGLCSSLQSLPSLQVVTGTSSQAAHAAAAPAATTVASSLCGGHIDRNGGGASPHPSSINIRVEDIGVEDLKVEGFSGGLGPAGFRGTNGNSQCEGVTHSLTGGHGDAGWMVLDDDNDGGDEGGVPQQHRGRRQVMLLPGRH